MTKHDFHDEFISIATAFNYGSEVDIITAASTHPLATRISRYNVYGELCQQLDKTEYPELLAILAGEFDLGPEEVCSALQLSEERL